MYLLKNVKMPCTQHHCSQAKASILLIWQKGEEKIYSFFLPSMIFKSQGGK